MYSTHFYRNTSLYGYVLFITLSTPPQEEEEVEERASLLAAVYHPSKELNQKTKTRKQFNNPICVKRQSCRVCFSSIQVKWRFYSHKKTCFTMSRRD